MDIEKYLAKPTKSVRKHTNELYEALNILVEQKYVFGHLLELLKEAIEYHDYGKVNKYGFIETPYVKVNNGVPNFDDIRYLAAEDEEDLFIIDCIFCSNSHVGTDL